LLPRERKTANCFEAPEVAHNRYVPVRRLAADAHQLHPERMTLTCQAIARPHACCHRACKQPTPAHSKATPVTMESPHSDHCRRRARHSQLNTTTSPVSRLPAACSQQQSSAVSRCKEIQPRLPNLQPNVSGTDLGEAAVGDRLSEQNHFPSSFAIRTTNSTITRMPTVVQIHIGIIMITPRA